MRKSELPCSGFVFAECRLRDGSETHELRLHGDNR
jgi:hypothetical protein